MPETTLFLLPSWWNGRHTCLRNKVLKVRILSSVQGVLIAPDGFRCVTFPPTINIIIGLIRNNSWFSSYQIKLGIFSVFSFFAAENKINCHHKNCERLGQRFILANVLPKDTLLTYGVRFYFWHFPREKVLIDHKTLDVVYWFIV